MLLSSAEPWKRIIQETAELMGLIAPTSGPGGSTKHLKRDDQQFLHSKKTTEPGKTTHTRMADAIGGKTKPMENQPPNPNHPLECGD